MSLTFAIRSISSPTLRVLAACLMFLSFTQLPAYADHIHHLWYNNSDWQDQDLTTLTNGGIPSAYGAIAAFRTTPNNQLHVYYADENTWHMHQLYYNGKTWSDDDLTSYTGGPQAIPYGISGFSIGNLQYVFYVSNPDYHVHEISYNNADWSDQDLTGLVGGNQANPQPILAFATKPNNQFHLYYQDLTTLHMYQLYFNGTSWTYQDLTSILGGAYCFRSEWIAGFASGNLQHLFCMGYGKYSNNLDLLHIYYNNSTWVYEDVTVKSGAAPMDQYAAVAGFNVPSAKTMEVYGITDSGDFNQFTHLTGPARWNDYDMTNFLGVPGDSEPGGIVGFVTPGNQYHIYYAPEAPYSEVYQLYYNGDAWTVDDLTNGEGDADPTSGMAGFAIGNLQHVFYMSID